MTIIWYKVPEIWSRTDRIFCHSGPFFALFTLPWTQKIKILKKMKKKNTWRYYHIQMCTINDSHDAWLLRYGVQQIGVFVILDHFLPFSPPNNLKNQNFDKMKKPSGDIILHRYTINDNHVMYCSWDTECDKHNFLSFWTIFCPFTPLKRYHSTQVYQNHDHMLYCSWDVAHDGCNCYFPFWAVFLPFYPSNSLKN